MELSKNYVPSSVEDKWYSHWLKKGYFSSEPDTRPAYAVVIPPPNVTGVLHMGHTLNETVQDILVRRARMNGFNACWVPGTDHASIATEAKVVQMLKERAIEKNDLSREEFLAYAYEWKEKYGGIIYNQIEKLGCSVDWKRVAFTMDPEYYRAVIKVFLDLYRKDMIYRGARMINWDPVAKTALSDEEVDYREQTGTLYYVKYKVIPENGQRYENPDYIVIATQRPETIMGDTAVCLNPSDTRYRYLHNAKAIIPLVNREVPVIFDEYVDPEFGTGALKVTPAHDLNDYNLGLKHNLQVIDTLKEDGTLSEAAEIFIGMDRFEARKKVIERLREEGLLVKEEEYMTRLGYSQRTHAVVEPRISTQWFVRMKELAKPALEAVQSGDIQIYPQEKFLARYRYWLENVKDWCISRQLWWGQRIPAWYDDQGNFVVAEDQDTALKEYEKLHGRKLSTLKQDDDVLDTWFSSWLWPIEVFKGITNPGNKDMSYYYPGAVLVTGQDIIFFWVARMIMAGMEYMKAKPFDDVYFTGMVRDKLGRKMSKSLGNSPDLLELIGKYGADATRFGILISSPAGNDLLYDESSLEQGRNFNNKLWNAMKLVKMWEGKQSPAEDEHTEHFAVTWFENRLNQARWDIGKMFQEYRLSEALKTLYSLIWDDFCSWYLEWVKPGFEQPIQSRIYQKTVEFFDSLLQLLHPFMPFISEEIYHLLAEREDDLCVRQFGPIREFDPALLSKGTDLQLLLTLGREFRQQQGLKQNIPIKLAIIPEPVFGKNQNIFMIISKQLNIGEIKFEKSESSSDGNYTVIPFKQYQIRFQLEHKPDSSKRREELSKELEYHRGFLFSIDKKLSNAKFIQNAKPEVIALEQKKKVDAEGKIKALEESLANL
jgi:valyl-tRNA synthetase